MSRATRPRADRSDRCTTVFSVPAMDCLSCARRISDELGGMSGVQKVTHDVVARDVRVEYDGEQVAAERIAAAIRELGYDVELEDGRERRATPEAHSVWSTPYAWRAYAGGALIGAALLLYLAGIRPSLLELASWRLELPGALLTAAALIAGYNFFPKAFRAARALRLDMNFLMTVAIFGALAIGEYVEAASIACLFSIAELMESSAVVRARRSIQELLRITPLSARVRRDGEVRRVPVEEVELGETVLIRPGEKVPVDGDVSSGVSAVDQSPITGESLPITKEAGDPVYAGSINRDGYLEVQTSRSAEDTTLAHIIQLVEEAEASRAPSERFVERFARYYTPAVTALAVLVMVAPPLFTGAAFTTWFVRGLTLLVISCPCALVISTPVAVVSALTSAARNGVLIKGGVHLEALGQVKAVAFDKTGTLTAGELQVVEVVAAKNGGPSEDELIELAAALEAGSEHPIAEAIRRAADEVNGRLDLEVSDFKALPGLGAEGRIGESLHRIGRPELFGEASAPWHDEITRLGGAGQTPICVGTESKVLGLIALADRQRESARAAVEGLRSLGVERIVMLTGDHEESARAMAEAIGVDEWYAGLLPEQKVDLVRQLESEAGAIAMVGDGVNDAPALAAATVGIAMGAVGSDVALETADVALMSDELDRLPYLFRLSRSGERVIRQNISVSIGVKLLLALGALPGLVNLITAVLVGDFGASFAVSGNALRLARIRA